MSYFTVSSVSYSRDLHGNSVPISQKDISSREPQRYAILLYLLYNIFSIARLVQGTVK